MPKNKGKNEIKMTLIVPRELWLKIGHKALDKGVSKNSLILEILKKTLEFEKG